jgi:uncharacterized coiled-coil DUF342 family protein
MQEMVKNMLEKMENMKLKLNKAKRRFTEYRKKIEKCNEAMAQMDAVLYTLRGVPELNAIIEMYLS